MDEISRMEKILRGDPIEPITRLEIFCAMAAGTWSGDPLTPVSRLEYFLSQISGGGGGGVTLSTLIEKPSGYNGELHYTRPDSQQLESPEGIAYDKVWSSDEYCTWQSKFAEGFFDSKGYNIQSYEYGKSMAVKHLYIRFVNSIGVNAFVGLSELTNLILPKTSVAALSNINAFTSTPFASGGSGGTLWVPENQISAYQSASNWSTILGYANNQIKKIEGSVWE